jgi:phosphoglucomutase/phosphomannomutase
MDRLLASVSAGCLVFAGAVQQQSGAVLLTPSAYRYRLLRGHLMDLMDQARAGFATIQVDDSLKEQALRLLRPWLTNAEFAAYRPQLEWLIREQQWAGLLDRFYQILPFGTGGRRGAVGIGPNRMNPWTLCASVEGHCEYLKERFPGVVPLRVVLAYDVRRFEDRRHAYNPQLPNPVLHLSSRNLAEHAAGVYVANGIHVHILPADSNRYLATPELSFSIRFLVAHGGLNISASHNPPDDNGGKFYDERGGQPIPPDDQIMADLVEQVTTPRVLPWNEAQRSGKIHLLDQGPHQAYLDLIRHQSLVSPPRFDEIRVVFTPLHGVGSQTAMEALVGQGFRVTPVEAQMAPDGQFPNVTRTPNPEVPESMDRAAAMAQQVAADLVLSTDPDADRLGAMIPDRQGTWRFVTGNEIAALLTHFKLSKLAQQGRLPGSPIVIKTEVTTGLITRIARHFKAQVVDDLLVGFKYIADVLWHLEQEGGYGDVRGTPADFVIGCEESHGILVTPQIRDKDAAGAALLLAELALDQKRQGRTVLDYLDQLARQFGYFRNEGVPVVMTGILGKRNMARMLDALRAAPPKEIGGLAVMGFEDLRDERGRLGPLKGATDAAGRNVLIFRLGERARVVLRPSGTEPKAKTYLEACSVPCPAGAPAEVWQRTCREVDELVKRLGQDFQRQALGLIGMEPGKSEP